MWQVSPDIAANIRLPCYKRCASEPCGIALAPHTTHTTETGLHHRQTHARSSLPVLGALKADLLQCASDDDKAKAAVNSALLDMGGAHCDKSACKSTMDLLLNTVQTQRVHALQDIE
jgi:hypothetical protein